MNHGTPFIQLPDYLPSRYSSWLSLYREVIASLEANGQKITEETVVNLAEFGFLDRHSSYSGEDVAFYQQWPLTLIKARALDFVLEKLPSFEQMIRVYNELIWSRSAAVYSLTPHIDALLNICPKQK